MKYLQNIKQLNATQNYINSEVNAKQVCSFPELISLTLLEKCNFNCIMCDQDHSSALELAQSGLQRIEEILPFAQNVCLTGGEPFLYSGIDSLLAKSADAQCNLFIQTNASLLGPERIDYIFANKVAGLKISCDGATAQTYEGIRRGGNFKRLLASLERIKHLKHKYATTYPSLEFNFVAMQDNIFELSKLVTLAREYGVERVNVFSLLAYTQEQARKSLYFYQDLSDYHLRKARAIALNLGIDLIAPPLFSEIQDSAQSCGPKVKCLSPWSHLTVNVNGETAICCGGAGNAGNICDQDFEVLWNHPKRQIIRETVNSDRELACCRNCRMIKQDSANPRSHVQDPDLLAQVVAELALEGNKYAQGAASLLKQDGV